MRTRRFSAIAGVNPGMVNKKTVNEQPNERNQNLRSGWVEQGLQY